MILARYLLFGFWTLRVGFRKSGMVAIVLGGACKGLNDKMSDVPVHTHGDFGKITFRGRGLIEKFRRTALSRLYVRSSGVGLGKGDLLRASVTIYFLRPPPLQAGAPQHTKKEKTRRHKPQVPQILKYRKDRKSGIMLVRAPISK